MKTFYIHHFLLPVVTSLLLTSCGKQDDPPRVESVSLSPNYTGDEAVKVREKTVIELLAVKEGVKQSIEEHLQADSIDTFVSDLESFRPRLEYIHMETSRLPKSEQMIVRGNLAVATNQLEKELLAMLAKSPGNDDLAMEIAHIREQLSPIPLGSMLRRY